MRSFLLKALRGPQTVARLLVDRLLVPFWLRLLGVRVGRACQFSGFPIVTLASGARITLGDGVVVNSRSHSNVAGVPHETILAALGPGSSILIGSGTGISGASIVASTAITIGNRVLIGAGACVWDTDFHPLDAEQRRLHATRGAASAPIRIEDDVFVGARSLILKGVTLGSQAIVGAGAVVTKDVGTATIVGGNPARVIGDARPVANEAGVS